MKTLTPETELILFDSHFIRIIASTDKPLDSDDPKITQRVEDSNGLDITPWASIKGINYSMRKSYLELELDLPGYDGPFCVPQLEFSLMFS
jgi:hypothetical protein